MEKYKILGGQPMIPTRYGADGTFQEPDAAPWFRRLHNIVYIKYVHNRQIFEKTENSIEIQGNLQYSINHRVKKVGRNNIFSINCDCVPLTPQDIVAARRDLC